MIMLTVNGVERGVDAAPDSPLLWALRDNLGLVGTKYGCGEGLCGACTVHIDGAAMRSCQVSVTQAAGKAVATIEGVLTVPAADVALAVTNAWVLAGVPQCGYCQPGFVMATIAAISADRSQARDAVLAQLSNICRCGSYDGLRTAVGLALGTLKRAAP